MNYTTRFKKVTKRFALNSHYILCSDRKHNLHAFEYAYNKSRVGKKETFPILPDVMAFIVVISLSTHDHTET